MDGTGSAARFNAPNQVAVDSSGNTYVADTNNNTIRKITPSGVVTTFAGAPGPGGSVDGTGAAARFNFPAGVAVDSNGNIYVADAINQTIRKITPSGVVSTFAGSAGSIGSANGTGSAARFHEPFGVATDSSGNVYVADTFNNTIRKITPGAVVTTLAGSAGNSGSTDGTGSNARFNSPYGLTVDSGGNVFVADTNNHTIRKVTSAGAVTTFAGSAGNSGTANGTLINARFASPEGITIDTNNNLYVADTGNSTIRMIGGGVVTTLAGSPGSTGGSDGTGSAAQFNFPVGVAAGTSGNVLVGDRDNNCIRKIATASAAVTTLAGLAGGPGSANGTGVNARFYSPSDVKADTAGNLYVADTSNHTIRKITSAGVVTTLAGLAGTAGSANGTGSAARFNNPQGIAVDGAGNIFVGDTDNHIIRKVTSSGVVTTLAGSAGNSGSTDGTTSNARFNYPIGVAVDSSGNVYVADAVNHTIRKISGGMVSTIAGAAGQTGTADGMGSNARFNIPSGVTISSSGIIYVADTDNHTIRKITTDGTVSTLAGFPGLSGSSDGSGTDAEFFQPRNLAIDGSGNIYVADYGNDLIRKVSPAGVVRTLAGTPGSSGSTDGLGTAALFLQPFGLGVDSSGFVFVADTDNNTIRKGGPAGTPVTKSAENTPIAIPDNDLNGIASFIFEVPDSGKNSNPLISITANITHPSPGDLRIFLSGPSDPGPQVTELLWDHESLVDSNQQPVANIHLLETVPFLGPGQYNLTMVDTVAGHSGTLDNWSVTVDPSYPNHSSPTVSLFGAMLQPLPTQINFGDPLTVAASGAGNPSSSYSIARLGLAITRADDAITGHFSGNGQLQYLPPETFQSPGTSFAFLSYSPPELGPGQYNITATALDSAGFSTQTSARLTVNRLFGFFSVSNVGTTLRSDHTTSFSAQLTLGNSTPTASGNLRITLVQVAGSAYLNDDPPPALPSPTPLASASIGPVNPLPAGSAQNPATEAVAVSGIIPAPVMTQSDGSGIGFQAYAILDELINGQWITVDSIKVTEGLWPTVNGFNGPGGGVNDPRPGLGGSPYDPYFLSSVVIAGPLGVIDSAQAQYLSNATTVNTSGQTKSADVTAYSAWSASQFTINSSTGLFQAGSVSLYTPVQITGSFTLGGITKMGGEFITVTPDRLTSVTRLTTTGHVGHILLQGLFTPNRMFTVKAAPDLQSQFMMIGTSTAGSDGTLQYEDDPGTQQHRYYRLTYP